MTNEPEPHFNLPPLTPAEWNEIGRFLSGDGLTESEDFILPEDPADADLQHLKHAAYAGAGVWDRLMALDEIYLRLEPRTN